MSEPTSKPAAELSPLKRAYLAIEELERKLAAATGKDSEPIAIVGIGCRLPGGVDGPDSFAELLRAGTDAISPVPPDGRPTYAVFRQDVPPPFQTMPPAGFLTADVAAFDPQFFGIAPREAVGMDPQQRLLLEVAWEALEDAGEAPSGLRDTATGVFVGICGGDYAQLQFAAHDPELLNAHFTSGIGHSVASGRLSYFLGLRGPSLSIDTACSSSLVATQLACRSLRAGECGMAIVGGVNLILDSNLTIAFMRSGMLAGDGRCKTFADGADGFARGEGCGVVILKPLATAIAERNRIYAVIRGIAVNQDGASSALSAPSGPAQEAVIRAALADARLAPADVDVVEAHGTGTELGDPIEMRALQGVFGGRSATARLAVGSVKTNLGHLEATAGVAGLIKLALALDREFVPAHLHWHTPSRHIPWQDLDIEVVATRRDWPRGARPRRGGVSSFGFSGTNCHAVLEEAPAPVVRADAVQRSRILTVSAANAAALRTLAERYAVRLSALSGNALADACFTASVGRAHLQHRMSVVARDGSEFAERLTAWLRDGWSPGVAAGRSPVELPRLAFAFTGQGSQYAGMGRRLHALLPEFRRTVESGAAAFRAATQRDLEEVLCAERADWLADTGIAQPALFVFEVALAQALLKFGLRPAVLLGHSIGEYAAACVAGVFSFEDGIRLTARRGQLMQLGTAPGAMLAVAASEADVAAAVEGFPDVSVAAVNGPGAVVVSGAPRSVAELEAAFRRRGSRTKQLDVPRAFHSVLMEPILDEFEREVAKVQLHPPRIRLISALTGKPLSAAEATSAHYWRRHVREPVRFAAAAAVAAQPGVAVEVGPRQVLSTFERDGDAASTTWIPALRRGVDDAEALLGALQTLYAAGYDLNWRAIADEQALQRVPLPLYPFQRQPHWVKLRAPFAVASVESSLHPLLGRRVSSAVSQLVFESEVSAERWSFVADHRVAGGIIMPGAGFIEALRAAGEQALGRAVALEDVVLHAALAVADSETRVMQVVVDAAEEGSAVGLYSRAANSEKDWTLHASARCQSAAAGSTAPRTVLATIRGRCPVAIDHDGFYAELAERQLAFGPALRGLRHGAVGRHEALAEVELPAALHAEAASYAIHPALLDACLQTVALTIRDEAKISRDRLFLPVQAAVCRWFAPAPTRCFVHARATALDDAALMLGVDLTVYDEQGSAVLAIEGLRFRSAGADLLRQLSARPLEKYLYEIEWRPVETPADRTAREVVGAWTAGLSADLQRRGQAHDIEGYERFFARFEALCVDVFAATLRQLGWNSLQASHSAADLAAAFGVAPQHRRLFERILAVASDSGVLRNDGGSFAPTPIDAVPDIDSRLAALLAERPDARAEISLVRRCAGALADALRGTVDALELLFPAGSLADAEELYRDSPLAAIFNTAVADGVERLVSASRQPLRVLEIGGGTGGTTSRVLERVGGRVDYTFTDVSALFTARAKARFARYERVSYRELDIEIDPKAQGFPAHGFDVVIASNVLHATADLGATMDRVRELLAPGGTLLALEVFAPHHWFDLTVGLTPGWWKFTDVDLRPSYPTLSAAAWIELLRAHGFDQPRAIPGAASGDGVFARQGIVVAESAARPAARSARSWLILGPQNDAAALATVLEAAGDRCDVLAGADLERARRHGGGLRGAVAERLAAGSCTGVVHLLALAGRAWDDRSATTLAVDLEQACGSALEVAAAAAAAEPAKAPVVWFVTRGAQVVSGDEFHLEPGQATLWGLGKTLDAEHPALEARRVDLDPSNPYEQSGTLAKLLLAGTTERQVALRDGQILAARMRHWRPADLQALVRSGEPYELGLRERGSIDSLELRPAMRLDPAADEVEIDVAATALNFKDVLNVLGLYPGDPGPLGSECAGVVTRVGANVEDLAVGDRVMAFVGGSFARFVRAPARQVVRVAAELRLTRAVTIPVAFLTAAYALLYCAKLRSTDRVLIHAATGGVGMAALQLARAAGAEIYATAGTPQKRELLRSLGVAHVYDSRTLEFTEQILRDSGGRGVDVVLNSLADEFVERSLAVTAMGGRFLEIGKRGIWTAEQVAALGRNIDYHVIDWGLTAVREPQLIRDLFIDVAGRLRRGEIEPLPARIFPIERLADAFRHMAQGRHIGKIVIAHQHSDAAAQAERIRADGTYVVAGGLSGLGLLTAEWLAGRGARYLALFGRRPPDAEAAGRIEVLRQSGVVVAVGCLDVAERAALDAFLSDARKKMPPVRGVVQSAGVLDDGVLLHQTWARFANVFAPKVYGSQHLHELTLGDPLDFFVLYSSMAALLGSAGQANHAAANAFLDTLAAARRLEGRPGLSINWGPWSETGAAVRHGVVARTAAKGLSALTPSEGFAILDLALQGNMAQVGAANVNWSTFLTGDGPTAPFFEALHSGTSRAPATLTAESERADAWLDEVAVLPAARQRAEVLRFVRAQMGRLLGLAGAAVETDRPLSEMGLDSLLAVETRNVLGKAFGLTLPATVTFDHPSIEALADFLSARKFGGAEAKEQKHTAKARGDALSSVEELADEDIDRLIEEKLRVND